MVCKNDPIRLICRDGEMTRPRLALTTFMAALATIVIVAPLEAQSRSSRDQRGSFRQTYERMQRDADRTSRRLQREGRERLRPRTCVNQNRLIKDRYGGSPSNTAGTTPTYCY